MSDTLALITRLCGLLAAENDLLRSLDFAATARLLPAKQAAADALGQAASAPAEALAPAVAALRALAEENRTLLERAMLVQGRVIELIARAACSADPAPRYARSGAYAARRDTGFALSARA